MSRRESSERREGGYSSMKEMLAKEQVGKSSTYLKLPKGSQLFKLKAGIMYIDIMPFVAGVGNPNASDGMKHWERTFWVHKSIGVDNEMFLCLAKSLGEKCPVCEFRASLTKKAAGDEDAFELSKSLEPKERQLFNVIDVKAPDKGIQVWDISKHLFGKDLMKEIRNSDEKDHWDEFWYLEQGFTLKIGVEERTFNGHSFPSVDTIHFKERDKDYPESILDDSPCLDECLVAPEYDDLRKLFLQSAEAPARERGGDRGGRDRGGDREERGSDRGERSSRRERDEAPPADEPRGRRSRRDEPDEPAPREERSERRSRRDEPDEPPARESRSERRGRDRGDDAPPVDDKGKGGDDPWASRDKGRKGKEDEAPPADEPRGRRSRRDEPDEPPRVRSDEDAESRRERGSRRDEPEEPRSERGGDREQPKDWGRFEGGRERGGSRDEAPAREERSERRSRR